jgi:hypothetical protein
MQNKEIKILKREARLAILSNRAHSDNGNIVRKLQRQLRNLKK